MDQQARAAFVISQAACMQAVCVAMLSQNELDRVADRRLTYTPQDFESLPDQYQLGHNSVISYLRGD